MINGFKPINGHDKLAYSLDMNVKGKDYKGILMVYRAVQPTYLNILAEVMMSAMHTDWAYDPANSDRLGNLMNAVYSVVGGSSYIEQKNTEVCVSGPVEGWLFDGKGLEEAIARTLTVQNEDNRESLQIRFALVDPRNVPHNLTDLYYSTEPSAERVHSNVVVETPGYRLPDLDSALSDRECCMIIGKRPLGRKLLEDFYSGWGKRSIRSLPDMTVFVRRLAAAEAVERVMGEHMQSNIVYIPDVLPE
jgi:hypothetical protein